MTSQHFDDGWDNNWGDWNENSSSSHNNNNNSQNSQQISQHNQQQFGHQSQPPMNSNTPIYSPFAYQQQQQPAPSQPTFMNTTSASAQHQPQVYPGNANVNFFNMTHNNESGGSNNNSAYNTVHPFEKVKNYQAPPTISTVQFSNSNLPPPPPPPASANVQAAPSSNEQNASVTTMAFSASLPLPPPPQSSVTSTTNSTSAHSQGSFDLNIQGNVAAQQTPSSIPAFDSNYNPLVTQPAYHHQYQSQWNDQRPPPLSQQHQQISSEMGAFNNSWHAQGLDSYANSQPPPPPPPTSSADWQNVSSMHQSSGANFFSVDYADTQSKDNHRNAPVSVAPSQSVQQQQPSKFENNENIHASMTESPAQPSLPPPSSSSSLFGTIQVDANQLSDRQAFESAYPENRERLDELPSIAPTLDRHNYLVTGQLSQDHSPVAFIPQQINQEQNLGDSLPPPGLSRMVVGEPENNQHQNSTASRSDIRMVTGNEMTPASYLNYQRQADGEVSSSSNSAPLRSHLPQSAFSHPQAPQQNVENDQQQNLSDRNLYLVAGESDVNSQRRVVPGVESYDSIIAPLSVINPLQNLHIEDDEDFVNISVTTQQRNVDGDGMEEQRNQRSIDVEQREEDIEGANDGNAMVVVNPPPPPPPLAPAVSAHESVVSAPLNDQEADIREDIEGANADSDPQPKLLLPMPQHANESLEEKRKSVDSGSKKKKPEMSSEDSELRELEKNARPKVRRSKKYDDSNDSESDHGRKRDKYDDRSKRSGVRDKMSREEYEKYRRRGKERRSGGGEGVRSKRNDDTDGSQYGSRRKTDDEDDENARRVRRSNRGRRVDEGEDIGVEKSRKRDKNHDRKKMYDDDRRKYRERDVYYPSGRPSSQNMSEREYERYPQHRGRGGYEGFYQQYDYSSYYQQQQYFETLRRTNPQAYEWYKNYYSGMMQQVHMQPGSTVDATESIRSGYSSSNEKDRASTSRFLPGGNVSNPLGSLNSSFIDNTNDYHSLQTAYHGVGKDFNQPYASINLNNQSYGYDIYGDLRAKTAPAATTDVIKSRMTPQKFQCLHGIVSLTNGLMTTIDTLNTNEKYLVKIENVPIYDRTRRLFQSYPGPLVRGLSHKKTVIEFCEEKSKQNGHLEGGSRASYSLLWSYLILMLRQNGTYTEADISELLMKNSDEFRSVYEVSIGDAKSGSNNHEGAVAGEDADVDENNTDVSDSEENISSERNSHTVSQSRETSTSVLTEKNVLDKFKNYLLYGNINDALDYATDNNLWGHALFLASKVDRRQHANVMLKFANKLSYNDPLQTLYQIMSGRMPACVTCLDDKFGDWRPHLAMIISNCTDKPELVKRSIVTLGDTLLARGDVYGSHFCYLLMDPQFTDYSDTTMANGKIALLGTTIQKSFKEFASTESIIMTEVYEYARSLSSESYFIASLQKYKFLLASNILDYGNQLKCLLYMEQISKCILQQPQLFDRNFIANVFTLADRLKFYDPVMEKSYEDNFNNNETVEDPKWLQDLSSVLLQSSAENAALSQSYAPVQQSTSSIPTYSPNDMYNPIEFQQPTFYDPTGSQHQTPTHAAQLATGSQAYEEHDAQHTTFDQQNMAFNNQIPSAVNNYNQAAVFDQHQPLDQSYSFNQNEAIQNENGNGVTQSQQFVQPGYDQNYQPDFNNSYSSWDQPRPTITMGNASKFGESSSQENTESSGINSSKEAKKSPAKTTDDKKQSAQDSKNASGGGGWFSGLFFGKAKSTQMKLPDDKNPAIVWDEATKKWVNKDEDPAEAESFKPPPKMDDMMRRTSQTLQNTPQFQQIPMQTQQQPVQPAPQMQQQPMMNPAPMQNAMLQQTHQPVQQHHQQQIQHQQPNVTSEQSPSMPVAPNMFKMQKGRNLKKSYVDILGNAGHTVSQPKELAPQMDMQFFNPQAQPQQGMQFYNPNDFQ